MLGVAGWLGALFLLGFVSAAFAFVFRSSDAALVVGLLCCAGAYLLFRFAPGNAFIGQFALATSLAGQAMFIFGVADSFKRDLAGAALVVCLFEAVLAVVVPNFIHRVLTTWASGTALFFALGRLEVPTLAPAVTASAFAGLWLAETRWLKHDASFRPIGYGLALALIQIDAQLLLGDLAWLVSRKPGPLAMAAFRIGRLGMPLVFSLAVARLLRSSEISLGSRAGLWALCSAVATALVLIPAPGATTALLVLLIGFSVGDRILQGLGHAALLGFVSHYYYQMQATLLAKSEVLVLTGALLIAAHFGLRRLFPGSEEQAHA